MKGMSLAYIRKKVATIKRIYGVTIIIKTAPNKKVYAVMENGEHLSSPSSYDEFWGWLIAFKEGVVMGKHNCKVNK